MRSSRGAQTPCVASEGQLLMVANITSGGVPPAIRETSLGRSEAARSAVTWMLGWARVKFSATLT